MIPPNADEVSTEKKDEDITSPAPSPIPPNVDKMSTEKKDDLTSPTSPPPVPPTAPHSNPTPISTLINSLRRPTLTSRSHPKYITGCSNLYVLISYVGSLTWAMINLAQGLTQHTYQTLDNIPYMSVPGSYFSMCVGCFLQPKNDSKFYKVLLASQAFNTFILPDLIALYFNLEVSILVSLTRICVGIFLFIFIAIFCRSKASQLSPERLSRFLTDVVLIRGIQALGIFIYFILDPIRCFLEYHGQLHDQYCLRTLLGQSGLVFILINYYMFSVINFIFPKHIVENQEISLHKIAMGTINWREGLQLLGKSVAYNAWGRLTDDEYALLLGTSILGAGSYLVVSTIEWIIMAKAERAWIKDGKPEPTTKKIPAWFAIKIGETGVVKNDMTHNDRWVVAKDEAEAREKAAAFLKCEPSEVLLDSNENELVLNLNKGFQVVALAATTSYTLCGTYITATLGSDYATLQGGLLPLTILFYVIGIFSDPRSGSKRYEFILFVSFTLEELNQIIFSIMREETWLIFGHFFRACLWLLFFKAAMKWRAKVAALTDAEITSFFIESVLKNCVRNIIMILFVTFRALNCVSVEYGILEDGIDGPIIAAINSCSNAIMCSMFISIYLVGFICAQMVIGALNERQREKNVISMENVVTMKGVNARQIMESSLSSVTLGCGMFLFCMMESKSEDSRQTLIDFGMIGSAATLLTFGSEVLMLVSTTIRKEELVRDIGGRNGMLNRQIMMQFWFRTFLEKNGWVIDDEGEGELKKNEAKEGKEEKEVVSEVSNFWIGLSFALTCIFMFFNVMFALGVPGMWQGIQDICIPIFLLAYVLSLLMKPLREDLAYKRFLYLHFTQFACFSEILGAIGNVLGPGEDYVAAVFNLLRIPVYFVIFKMMMGLRQSIAKLPKDELSEFLVHVLLVNGAGCLTTILFFLCELVSCWIEEADEKDGEEENAQNTTTADIDHGPHYLCANTDNASLWLSIFLVFAMMITVMSRAVPRATRNSVAMTKERLATLDVDKKEALQGFLFIIVGVASLFLLSTLGVAGDSTATNLYLGMGGGAAFTLIFVIETVILLAQNNKQSLLESEEEEEEGAGGEGTGVNKRISKLQEMQTIESSRKMVGINDFCDPTGMTGFA
ncbi:hypothetical protein TL16_g02385 [Triparma laevis f. inornata]|uniref:Uncharacterized protein n=1 Tax=Triparma laevis f. inornata TaxID=1714386 RepID=A0A9W6ZS88_9STRA|nr:hypothetical protein TL16_g02385 [Triparma laevis f. inornata]